MRSPTAVRRRNGRLMGAAAVVLAGTATLRLAGTVVFTFFTAPEDGGVATSADRAFAAWSGGMALALLVTARSPCSAGCAGPSAPPWGCWCWT